MQQYTNIHQDNKGVWGLGLPFTIFKDIDMFNKKNIISAGFPFSDVFFIINWKKFIYLFHKNIKKGSVPVPNTPESCECKTDVKQKCINFYMKMRLKTAIQR